MRGKFAVVALLGLAFAAPPAAAEEPAHRDISLDADKALIEVKIPSVALYDRLFTSFDFTTRPSATATGRSPPTCSPTPRSGALRAAGRPGRPHARDRRRHQRRNGEREARAARRSARGPSRRPAPTARGAEGAIPLPGEVVIQRAYTFTNYAGRFLYVEAHTKAATRRRGARR